MREIKFRGKRIDNNEWIYGYLVKSEDYIFDYSERIDIPYIIPFNNFNLKDYREYRVEEKKLVNLLNYMIKIINQFTKEI